MQVHKLGKKSFKGYHPGTLKLKDYLLPKAQRGVIPPPPSEVSWVTKVPGPWPMLLNDQLGDCVPAAMLHMIQQWTYFASSKQVVGTNAQVQQLYEAIGGYVPGDPSTDNGCDMQVALAYWKSNGLMGAHKILGWATVDWSNIEEVFQAIELFGNVFVGISLPITAQGENDWTVSRGGVYTPNGTPGSWGGHCIPYMAASPFSRTCITWGEALKLSPNFSLDYVEEMYVVASADWFSVQGSTPSGLDKAALLADMALL